jgi:hypothetical protein
MHASEVYVPPTGMLLDTERHQGLSVYLRISLSISANQPIETADS